MASNDKDAHVCVVTPERCAITETFIQAHIERLPTSVSTLYGDFLPIFKGDNEPLLPRLQVGINRTLSKLLNLPPDSLHTSVSQRYPNYYRKTALRRFLKSTNVKAVLAEYGPTGVALRAVCNDLAIPLVVHFHGYDAYRRSTLEEYGTQYRELFQSAAAVLVVSRDMERQLSSLGALQQNLHYNPYGVDPSIFLSGDPRNAPPLFIAVGRFVPKKAPHLTLRAFHKVLERVPQAKLIMIGDGPLLARCQQLSSDLGLGDSAQFLGPRPHTEVAALLRQARAFVQHSIRSSDGDCEGTPVAILEAGAAGLPVVATRHGGIQDVVVEEETGFLANEGDFETMAESMIRLAQEGELAGRLGANARRRICAEFSMDKSIGRLWQIIETAIDRKHVSSYDNLKNQPWN
jgi:glycosyltransferase involved in cell wall biosynthesis